MIRTRFNPHTPCTSHLAELELADHELPSAWIRAAAAALRGDEQGERAYVLLTGTADLVGFRMRLAQAQLRADALPGFFNGAALVFDRPGAEPELLHVPLWGSEPPGTVPRRNGIERKVLGHLDALPGLYPNLALLSYPLDDVEPLRQAAQALRGARLTDDFVTPIPAWLSYVWSGKCEDPMKAGLGEPSSMFVEACYAACRVDIVPGMSERIVCPEAIWQGMKWWCDTFAGGAKGRYRIRQGEAAVTFGG